MFPAVKLYSLREQLSLSHDNVYDFAVFSWQSKRNQVSGHYLVYRFVVAALFLAVVTFCGSRSNHPEYWMIYLSHIGLILQTLHLAISAAVPVQLLLLASRNRIDNEMLPLARLSWFLYNVTNLLSLVISVVFWAVLFTPGKGLKDRDVLVHALNSVMSISDIFISKRPCRMLHFHHSLAALIPYVTFSAIYWAAGGTRENGLSYIYPILNWENLSLTVPFLMMGLIFGLPFVHGIIWSLHLLRDRLIRCCKCDDHHDHQSQWNSAFVPDDKSADSTIVIKA